MNQRTKTRAAREKNGLKVKLESGSSSPAYCDVYTSLRSAGIVVPDVGLSKGLFHRDGMGLHLQPGLLGAVKGLQRGIQSLVEPADAV